MEALCLILLAITCSLLIISESVRKDLEKRFAILWGNHRILQAQYFEQSSWNQKLALENYELKKRLPPELLRPSPELMKWADEEDARRATKALLEEQGCKVD